MGNGMACCGKQDDDPNNLNTATLGKDKHSLNKLRMIVKIQAAIRGYLTRKRVRGLKEGQFGGKAMMNHFNFSGPTNFENPDVQVRNIHYYEII